MLAPLLTAVNAALFALILQICSLIFEKLKLYLFICFKKLCEDCVRDYKGISLWSLHLQTAP